MKKLLQSLFVFLLFASTTMAQERIITGTVTSTEDSSPLPGVSVKAVGSQAVAVTGNDGKFSLRVSSAVKSVQFSFIGYATKTVNLTSANAIKIGLDVDAKSLQDVVITQAYGTTTKGKNTGSISSVGSEEIAKRPVTNLNSVLAGAAPGVQVNAGSGQPGSGPTIRVRGFGSISASNDPLYVVDGIQYSGDISNISVDDIESISLLKDAASSALYGSSAGNGVILITTKKGRQGKEQLNFRIIQGITSRGIPEYETVGAYEYYPLAWQAYRNSLVYPVTGTGVSLAAANTTATNGIKALLGNNPFNVANNAIVGTDGLMNPNASLLYADDLDWRSPLERTGQRSDYSMSYSGATEKSDFYASLGYLKEKGYVIRSDFNRINGRVSINTKPLTWFKTGLNLNANITKSNQADADGSGSIVNPFNFSRYMGPIYPLYAHNQTTGEYLLDLKGEKIYDTGNLLGTLGIPNRPSGAYAGRHILEETLLNSTQIKRNVLSARTYGEITFLKDFKFTQNLGVDISNYSFADYQNKIVGDGAPGGRARNTSTTTTTYTIEQLLNYNKKVGKNSFSALLGHNNYDYTYKYLTGARNTQVVDGNSELINFTTTTDLSSYLRDYRKEAVFARLNYDYDSKYFLTGSFRRDGSSKWGPGKQWGNFYSASAAWLISEENFLKDKTWINYLKLRSSYGSLGNDGLTGFNLDRALYSLDYNNAAEPGILLQSLANANITWETQTQIDAAVEFGLFKNRLHGSIELFNKQSKDLLFNVPLPLSTGLGIGSGTGTYPKNIGKMWNKGIEINLGGDIVKTQNFKWGMDINWSLVRNKITKMPEETPTIIDGTKQLAVDRSRYEYWLRQWAGVDPTDGEGYYLINPLSPGSAADTRTINGQQYTINPNNALYAYSGSSIPKFFGSVTNNFTYKAFSLSVIMNYQVGGKAYDATYQSLMSYSGYGGALHIDALKSWQQVGDPSGIPRLDVGRSTFNNATSTRFLIDASYLNMRSATLAYNLPSAFIKKVGLSKVSVYASGENLFLVSKRKGLDPSESFTGVNTNNYTPTRILSLGLNASF
ncbi:SusC/RagA family TonB-linked outer membrane protein [Pedobacter punctiformis]|uniref:SusC/RagA family TonB-linked outer membrane protein n=1 Tax=Pedobacter punctiformis TaxID=3004097 RepID=A0ABT4L5T0_9SPHI|nr:SusC/RagA family TonB-linked outer membrane protein [Pedobacter sp. HCMS5-2]MCZ4243277.1 SusC/RagA family TonB-linked outer membrane protein [Pedobacter sp. HCMS5-2]